MMHKRKYLGIKNVRVVWNVTKYFLITYLIFSFSIFTIAQTAPVFVPNDFDFEIEDVGCVCSPGVINKSPGKGLLLEYKLTSGGNFTPDEVPVGIDPSKINSLSRLRFRLKIPVLLKHKTKILLGIDHFREKYSLSFVQPAFTKQLQFIDGNALKTSRLSAYLLQSMGENNYLGVRARVSYSGNYDGLFGKDPFYRQIRVSGIWGIKKREDLEMGLGFFYSNSFTRNIVLPFFLYNRTFNERWGIEAAFPVSVQMRYNINPRNLILFGPEFSSAAYALKGKDNLSKDYYFQHTELNFGAKYERQLTNWVWINAFAGVQINFDSQYENVLDSNDLFEPDLITGGFFQIGLFLSPPDNLHKD